jgi:hypothetical protein
MTSQPLCDFNPERVRGLYPQALRVTLLEPADRLHGGSRITGLMLAVREPVERLVLA